MEEIIRAVVHTVGAARGPQLAPLADFMVQLLMLRVGAAGERVTQSRNHAINYSSPTHIPPFLHRI